MGLFAGSGRHWLIGAVLACFHCSLTAATRFPFRSLSRFEARKLQGGQRQVGAVVPVHLPEPEAHEHLLDGRAFDDKVQCLGLLLNEP